MFERDVVEVIPAEAFLIVPMTVYPNRLGLLVIRHNAGDKVSLPGARQLPGETCWENALRITKAQTAIACATDVGRLRTFWVDDGKIEMPIGLALPINYPHLIVPRDVAEAFTITVPVEATTPQQTEAIAMFFAGAPK